MMSMNERREGEGGRDAMDGMSLKGKGLVRKGDNLVQ